MASTLNTESYTISESESSGFVLRLVKEPVIVLVNSSAYIIIKAPAKDEFGSRYIFNYWKILN